jgi:hypothetical protein
MTTNKLYNWLLQGDVVIQYQTHRDLMESDLTILNELKTRIQFEGWGKQFLNSGRQLYQPKWINTHYFLFDIKNICISPDIKEIKETLSAIFKYEKGMDG